MKKLYAKFILWLIRPALHLEKCKTINKPEQLNEDVPKLSNATQGILEQIFENRNVPPKPKPEVEDDDLFSRPPKYFVGMTLGERVRMVREYRGFSRSRLAAVSGVGEGAIYNYEKNLHQPNPARLDAISRALKVDKMFLKGVTNQICSR